MTKTINTTTFSATNGETTMDFEVTGALSQGKARAHAAKEMGCDKKLITLTTPLCITSATYVISEELVVKYGTKIED